MARYLGSLEQLKNELTTFGLNGQWAEILNADKFSTPDGSHLILYHNGTLQCQSKAKSISKAKIEAFIESVDGKVNISATSTSNSPETSAKEALFVVFGHDRASRDQLELILKTVGIKPIILGRDGAGGLTLIEELEKHVGKDGSARAGIVLLTPDDIGYAKADGGTAAKSRARQNVVMEMGMLLGSLGRQNTIILVKGDVEKPSDVNGIFYLQYQAHVNETAIRLAKRLESCGFDIDHKELNNLF